MIMPLKYGVIMNVSQNSFSSPDFSRTESNSSLKKKKEQELIDLVVSSGKLPESSQNVDFPKVTIPKVISSYIPSWLKKCLTVIAIFSIAKIYLNSDEGVSTSPDQVCSLSTYVEPGHSFLKLHCDGISPDVYGFYPGSNPIISKGGIADDIIRLKQCKTLHNCAAATFKLTREQYLKASEYINDLQISCDDSNSNSGDCIYSLIGYNCVDFLTDVVKKAGIKANWFKYLKVDKNFPQTWGRTSAYIYLKTLGGVKLWH